MRNKKGSLSAWGIRRLLVGLIMSAALLAPSWAQSENPGYGFLVSASSPFYNGGETAALELNLFNFSDSDAFGYSPQGGDVGCTFNVRVENEDGATLWQPGECHDRTFFAGRVCARIVLPINLTSGSTAVNLFDLPLVQSNPAACQAGADGAPLPAGRYKICVDKVFNGPNTEQRFERGLSPTACIPIRIRDASEDAGGS